MKNFRTTTLLFFFAVLIFFSTCKNRQNNDTQQKMEQKVFVVKIVPDTDSMQRYIDYHQHVWPQVEQGFRKAGYKKIALYRYGQLIVMTILVPEGSDLAEMGKVAESYDKRCAEWSQLMSNYHVGVDGTKPGEKWVEAQLIYNFTRE